MSEIDLARDESLDHRGGASHLNVLDVKAVFFVDPRLDRDLDMIRGAADVGNADFATHLSKRRLTAIRKEDSGEN